jgi:signal transduction histidine kinase
VSAHPPLFIRLLPRLWVALDYAAAGACLLILAGFLYRPGRPEFLITGWYARYWLPLLLAAALSAPVALRRRDPARALLAVLTAGVVTMALGGQVTRGPFLPIMIVLYLVAATCPRRLALRWLAATLALLAVQGVILRLTSAGAGPAVGIGLVLIIVWLLGDTVRQRRSYVAHLRAQAAGEAVTEERLRIARELHDVVAHSMTVVAVQAGFGEYVFDSQPREARASLAAIQTVTREALEDMQRLLGVLRQAGPGPAGSPAPLAPAPGLAGLDRLIAGTAGAGVKVDLDCTGQVRSLPPGIDLAAFRIVQEALTNVVKHSGSDCCAVSIGYGADQLSVEISDSGPGSSPATLAAAGAGHGITGMRERVSLCGGEFSAGPLPDRGFRVSASFPLAAGAQQAQGAR